MDALVAAPSAETLDAARRAWAAAKRNPEVYATNSFTGSGGYGDNDLSDELYWATAELWATTGEAVYGDAGAACAVCADDCSALGWS